MRWRTIPSLECEIANLELMPTTFESADGDEGHVPAKGTCPFIA